MKHLIKLSNTLSQKIQPNFTRLGFFILFTFFPLTIIDVKTNNTCVLY